MYKEIAFEMVDFINSSPSAEFAVKGIKNRLSGENYEELFENETWDIHEGGRYYFTRSDRSLIAFRIPCREVYSYHAVMSHSDSPSLKLKPNFEIDTKEFKKLAVEKYGGPVLDSFFDTPLDIAGSVVLSCEDGVRKRLLRLENACMIPRIAPHLSREQGTNPAVDMYPFYATDKGSIAEKIADTLGVEKEDILSCDLYVVPSTRGIVWGEKNEFVSSPRLDDLQSVFTSFAGFLNSDETSAIPVLAVFDSEEVGNVGAEGAGSTLLEYTLERISACLGKSREEHFAMLSESFFVSADVAHAKHPNHPELYDSANAPVINGGVAIKYNANKRYVTTSMSAALFAKIANMAQVPVQVYANRSDIPGGSTLGSDAQSIVSVLSIDIGAPILSMHSSFETAGARDTEYLARVFEMFYSTSLEKVGDGYIIK